MRQEPLKITKAEARRLWLRGQRLDEAAPFGEGAPATLAAIEHLGYVQIDTIHVIERAHHHILWSRIPAYRRADLRQAQSIDKSVFEYWTHALSYVPTRHLPFFLPEMKRYRKAPSKWFASVRKEEVRKVVSRIRKEGALSIRDIGDDVLVEKDHAWASRKPSRRALQLAFFNGVLTVSERAGMLKSYDLIDRHFGWETRPRPASEKAVVDYLLDRALRAQGAVSLDSVCHLDAKRKGPVLKAIEARARRGLLLPVAIEGAEKIAHWAEPRALEEKSPEGEAAHILSPFDPLIIQRRRLKALFDYDHRFEAYAPKEKRVFGYFALPALIGDRIVAAIDIKADRERRRLQIRRWTWIGPRSERPRKAQIENILHRFAAFQFAP